MNKELINNEEKTMSGEEIGAVKELIEKIPPEDLEKAVGGMSERQIKLLKAAGIIVLTAASVGYIKRDSLRQALPKSLGGVEKPPVKHKMSEFYTRGRLWGKNLKEGFCEYEGKIYDMNDIIDTTYDITSPDLRPKEGATPLAVISELEDDMKK